MYCIFSAQCLYGCLSVSGMCLWKNTGKVSSINQYVTISLKHRERLVITCMWFSLYFIITISLFFCRRSLSASKKEKQYPLFKFVKDTKFYFCLMALGGYVCICSHSSAMLSKLDQKEKTVYIIQLLLCHTLVYKLYSDYFYVSSMSIYVTNLFIEFNSWKLLLYCARLTEC